MTNNQEDKDAYTNIVTYMNNERPGTLLTYAWNLCGKNNACYAIMTSMNSIGFTLDVSTKSKKTSTCEYKFALELSSPNQARSILMDLHEVSSVTTFPPEGYFSILLWLIFFIGNANKTNLGSFGYLNDLVLMILRKQIYATYGLIFLIVSHSLESLYVFYLCYQMKMPLSIIMSWCSLDLLLGFPTTQQVKLLHSVTTKKRKSN
jgi:hypothetical protein